MHTPASSHHSRVPKVQHFEPFRYFCPLGWAGRNAALRRQSCAALPHPHLRLCASSRLLLPLPCSFREHFQGLCPLHHYSSLPVEISASSNFLQLLQNISKLLGCDSVILDYIFEYQDLFLNIQIYQSYNLQLLNRCRYA